MATNGRTETNGHSTNGNGTNGAKPPNWEPLLEQPAYTPTRRMRVVCVGGGMSALILAYKIQHEFKLEDEIDFAVYDRNPEIGGTWYENTYPGASSDVPAHAYVMPFEGNPDWSSFYAGQAEILEYLKRTAAKYNLTKHFQLNTEIVETIWDEDSAKWKILLEHNGERKEDEADFLINGSGFLNKWKWPDVPGRDIFKGKMVHTARWDNSYNVEGKRVAVLGNGSSGIQVVSSIAPKVSKLVNYMRQPTWIARNFLDTKTPQGVNFKYSEEQKRTWREKPETLLAYRKEMEQSMNSFFYCMVVGHPYQEAYEKECKDRMHDSMKDSPELEARIVPKYHAGCRRITPGDGYLEALQAPNCRASWDTIIEFTEKGIRTAEGEEEFDMIVCATGFDPSWLPQWKLVGRGGARLEDMWAEDPTAFFATQVAHMPNYGMINGPNPPISHGSVPSTMNWAADYLLGWIQRMRREDIRTVVVRPEAVDDFNVYSQEFLKRTVWAGGCRTLYKNGRAMGRMTGVYAGSLPHYREGLKKALNSGEHFEFTWRSKNRFRCLGNGTVAEEKNGEGDMASYMDDLASLFKINEKAAWADQN